MPDSTSTKLVTLEGHVDRVSDVVWLSNDRLVTSGFDATIRTWDASNGKALASLPVQPDLLFALAASPDGKLLAWGGKDRTVRLANVDSPDKPKELTGHAKSVFRIVFSPDGKQLASCGEDDSQILFWDADSGKSLRRANAEDPDDKNQRRSIFGLAYSHDGKQLASCGADRTIRLWDVETAKEMRRFSAVEYVLFKEKDKKIDRETKKGASEFALYSVAFSPSGKQIASGGLDKTIRIWDTSSGELQRTLTGHDGFVNDLEFTADGSRLFSCGHGGKLHLWDLSKGDVVWSAKVPSLAQSAALSSDGKRVAAACADGKAYIVSLS